MRRVSTQEDALLLLLNRCQARLSSQHYDAALEDATAVLEMDMKCEKALFRAARASYNLGSFAKCRSYLAELTSLYPANKAAVKDIEQCELRIQEQAGRFDFVSMLEEAVIKQPSPRLDRAPYIGPIQVRQCAIESHGRGLFTTRTVKPGELLLCEKAFATAFAPDVAPAETDTPKGNQPAGTDSLKEKQPAGTDSLKGDHRAGTDSPEENQADNGLKWRLKLRAELATTTFIKLIRNPSVVSAFAGLYPGPDSDEDLDEDTNLPAVDE